jgi:alpha-L-arabinofuranosidase
MGHDISEHKKIKIREIKTKMCRLKILDCLSQWGVWFASDKRDDQKERGCCANIKRQILKQIELQNTLRTHHSTILTIYMTMHLLFILLCLMLDDFIRQVGQLSGLIKLFAHATC